MWKHRLLQKNQALTIINDNMYFLNCSCTLWYSMICPRLAKKPPRWVSGIKIKSAALSIWIYLETYINDVQCFGIIIDPSTPPNSRFFLVILDTNHPKIGHHLCRKHGTLNQNDFIIFLPFLSAKENLSPYQRANSVRVSRNRGCNESFRAAVDRSYENDFPEVKLFYFIFILLFFPKKWSI